jgi:hydrogenase expression/formation protein HypD
MVPEPDRLVSAIRKLAGKIGRPLKFMEVCGTHTVAIFRHGIRGLLEEAGISFLSGPGCPVCVTAQKDVDAAITLARTQDVVLATFGDMMRVPGSLGSLYKARAEGGSVQVVYSPTDALELARALKDKQVVFFATGFETTSPSVAAALAIAREDGVRNFRIYCVHKTVPPALRALLSAPELRLDGFLLPGHVSTIIGTVPYDFIAQERGINAVVAGFSASDILEAVLVLLKAVSAGGEAEIANQYGRAVKREGNLKAQEMLDKTFVPCDSVWRGIGTIPGSGLALRQEFAHLDATCAFELNVPEAPEPKGCSCGEVLRGIKIPTECRLFARRCTPENPVGACMVSTEGSCAAYYKYGLDAKK